MVDILTIEKMAGRLQDELQARGAPIIEMSRSTRTGVIADALDFLFFRKGILPIEDKIAIAEKEKTLLRYYANAIAHWSGPRA